MKQLFFAVALLVFAAATGYSQTKNPSANSGQSRELDRLDKTNAVHEGRSEGSSSSKGGGDKGSGKDKAGKGGNDKGPSDKGGGNKDKKDKP